MRDKVTPEDRSKCPQCGRPKTKMSARTCRDCYLLGRKFTSSVFWLRVDRSAGLYGCWIWLGFGNPYGGVHVDGRRMGAHRYAYELAYGAIGDSHLDHLCRTPACVNPSHLERVSNRENVLRGIVPSAVNARRTECAHGHSFDRIDRDGKRRCRECGRLRQAKCRAARRAKESA